MLRNKTNLLDKVKARISDALRPLAPKKVILFGSYAWGQPNQDSDIDLIVVLDSRKTPKTYQERANNRLQVRRALDELNREYSLDVLVYTVPEWDQFKNQHTAFSDEIVNSGVVV